MKTILLGLALFGSAVSAHAADVLAPVKEIMQQATDSWAETPGNARDYFDEDRLGRIFSKDFAKLYHEAAKFPAYDDGPSPFDYDVIVNAQDGCTLKDLTIDATPAVAGITDVKVTFDNTHCFGERAADWKPSEVHFKVIEEGGHPVIDDILTADDSGSLKAQMQDIARQGTQ